MIGKNVYAVRGKIRWLVVGKENSLSVFYRILVLEEIVELYWMAWYTIYIVWNGKWKVDCVAYQWKRETVTGWGTEKGQKWKSKIYWILFFHSGLNHERAVGREEGYGKEYKWVWESIKYKSDELGCLDE